MKRFVLPSPPDPGGIIRLRGKDYHYLVRVRRLKPGMSFDALLPGGAETRVTVLSTGDNVLAGACAGAPEENAGPPLAEAKRCPPIALFQALPKGNKMDLIVRQAAEGGVSLVAPFESENSTARLSGRSGGNSAETFSGEKLRRWERIVKEARQQSGSATETEVLAPCAFPALIDYWESLKKKYSRPLGVVLHQEPLEKGTLHHYLDSCPDFVALAVGPEGGFSVQEISWFRAAGFRPFLFGNTVLRTETAALCGCAAIRIILLESEAWTPRLTECCS